MVLQQFRPKTRERPDGDPEEDGPETQKKSKRGKKWTGKNWRRIFKKKKKVEGDGEAGQSSVTPRPSNMDHGDGAEVLMALVEKPEPDPADGEDLMSCRLDGAEKIISQQQNQILDGTDTAAEERATEDLSNFMLDEDRAAEDVGNFPLDENEAGAERLLAGNETLEVMDLNTGTEDEDIRELMNFLQDKTEEQIELLKMKDTEAEIEAITELKENMTDDVETPSNKLLGDPITEEMDAEGGFALVKDLVNVLLEKTEEKIELLNVQDAEAETENLMENMLDDLDGSGEQLLTGEKVPEVMDEDVEMETAEDVKKFLLNENEANMQVMDEAVEAETAENVKKFLLNKTENVMENMLDDLDGSGEQLLAREKVPEVMDEDVEMETAEDVKKFLRNENEANMQVMDEAVEAETAENVKKFLLNKTENVMENMLDDLDRSGEQLLAGEKVPEVMDEDVEMETAEDVKKFLLNENEANMQVMDEAVEAETAENVKKFLLNKTENVMENMLDDLDGSGEQLLAGEKVPEVMDEAVETAEDVKKFLLNKSEASMDEGLAEMVVEVKNVVEDENDIRAEVEQILNLVLDEIELKVTKQQNEVDEMEKINQQILMIKDEEKDIKKDELLNDGGEGTLTMKRRRGTRGHGRKINYKKKEKEESEKDQHQEKEPTMKLVDKDGGGKPKNWRRRGTRGKGRKINYKKKEEVEQIVENKEPHGGAAADGKAEEQRRSAEGHERAGGRREAAYSEVVRNAYGGRSWYRQDWYQYGQHPPEPVWRNYRMDERNTWRYGGRHWERRNMWTPPAANYYYNPNY
ncbi:transcription factor TFIIIB component B'' homolog [Trichomycterus rosablanca]|uniref:transcription factor TFIIIB component B'' homolog n=1 Tax=Trichomycterus rosablanca TaxID=2290929 RepID=UPI002F3585D4